MFCPNCGKQQKNETKFCSECGTNLSIKFGHQNSKSAFIQKIGSKGKQITFKQITWTGVVLLFIITLIAIIPIITDKVQEYLKDIEAKRKSIEEARKQEKLREDQENKIKEFQRINIKGRELINQGKILEAIDTLKKANEYESLVKDDEKVLYRNFLKDCKKVFDTTSAIKILVTFSDNEWKDFDKEEIIPNRLKIGNTLLNSKYSDFLISLKKQGLEERLKEQKKQKQLKAETDRKLARKQSLQRYYDSITSNAYLYEIKERLSDKGFVLVKSEYEKAPDGSNQLAEYFEKTEDNFTFVIKIRLQSSYSIDRYYRRVEIEEIK